MKCAKHKKDQTRRKHVPVFRTKPTISYWFTRLISAHGQWSYRVGLDTSSWIWNEFEQTRHISERILSVRKRCIQATDKLRVCCSRLATSVAWLQVMKQGNRRRQTQCRPCAAPGESLWVYALIASPIHGHCYYYYHHYYYTWVKGKVKVK